MYGGTCSVLQVRRYIARRCVQDEKRDVNGSWVVKNGGGRRRERTSERGYWGEVTSMVRGARGLN